MPDGEEYVEDGSVKWGGRDGVAGAIAGSILTLIGYGIASWYGLLSAGANRVMSGFAWFLSAAISTPFDGAVRIMNTAWAEFGAFLPTLGPLAFPVAVVVTVGVLLILFWGVSRVVWGV